jgi:hypothetical protein
LRRARDTHAISSIPSPTASPLVDPAPFGEALQLTPPPSTRPPSLAGGGVTHTPLVHVPERQLEASLQVEPSTEPQSPSVPQTFEPHCEGCVHGVPLAPFVVQAPVGPQYLLAGHSASDAHSTHTFVVLHLLLRHSSTDPQGPSPFAYPQLPSLSQTLLRQSDAVPLHGPSPLAKPHLLSVGSHAPEMQTRAPTVSLQVATVAGEAGSGVPFASLGTQEPEPPVAALHHWLEAQSPSTLHARPQAPEGASQIGPSGCPAQSALLVHLPHCPAAVPLVVQKGALSAHASFAVVSP